MNASPRRGSTTPDANCAFAYASPNVRPVPMTSPGDFISGPRIGSASGNLLNGNTDSLTEKYGRLPGIVKPCSLKLMPAIAFDAIFASGWPIAFDTNGIVRDARGFTSST